MPEGSSAGAAPLTVWREPVQDAWIDYNGHLSEAYYVLVMGHATDAVMDALGMGPAYQGAHDSSFYTVEAHVRYLAEIRAGVELEVRSWVVGHTSKLAWFWHELWAEGELRATEDILGVHVTAGASSSFPKDVLARLVEVTVAPPTGAGRRIAITS